MNERLLTRDDVDILLDVLRIDTVNPLETKTSGSTGPALDLICEYATALGFSAERCRPDDRVLQVPSIPRSVLAAADRIGVDRLLSGQQSAVFRLGHDSAVARRLVVNFHVDTVGPMLAARLDRDGTISGRGAVDAKGPGLSAMKGIADAYRRLQGRNHSVCFEVHAVCGEEGGALGYLGTRALYESGRPGGDLTVYAEPSDMAVQDVCRATMTPVFTIDGSDSTDDYPGHGHNATAALSWIVAQVLTQVLPVVEREGQNLTVGGLHTGSMHNRVYGRGHVKMNASYDDLAVADKFARAFDRVVEDARTSFVSAFADTPTLGRTAADWSDVVRLVWEKRGLPALRNRDPMMEEVLAAADVQRAPEGSYVPITCDAIWNSMGGGGYGAVYGPGSLQRNGAHTDREHVALAELDRYGRSISTLATCFAHASNTL